MKDMINTQGMQKLNDDDLEQVVGGMGMESQFVDLEGGMCQCRKCHQTMQSSLAAIHAMQCKGGSGVTNRALA